MCVIGGKSKAFAHIREAALIKKGSRGHFLQKSVTKCAPMVYENSMSLPSKIDPASIQGAFPNANSQKIGVSTSKASKTAAAQAPRARVNVTPQAIAVAAIVERVQTAAHAAAPFEHQIAKFAQDAVKHYSQAFLDKNLTLDKLSLAEKLSLLPESVTQTLHDGHKAFKEDYAVALDFLAPRGSTQRADLENLSWGELLALLPPELASKLSAERHEVIMESLRAWAKDLEEQAKADREQAERHNKEAAFERSVDEHRRTDARIAKGAVERDTNISRNEYSRFLAQQFSKNVYIKLAVVYNGNVGTQEIAYAANANPVDKFTTYNVTSSVEVSDARATRKALTTPEGKSLHDGFGTPEYYLR